MAADDQGRLWFVETGPQPNQLIGFDPASEEFFSLTKIKDSGGATRHMIFHDNALWFGLDTGFIGRATIPGNFSK
jgi:virginiamycin B lyase